MKYQAAYRLKLNKEIEANDGGGVQDADGGAGSDAWRGCALVWGKFRRSREPQTAHEAVQNCYDWAVGGLLRRRLKQRQSLLQGGLDLSITL